MKTLKTLLVLTMICIILYSCKDNNEETNYRVKQIISTNFNGVEINKLILNYNEDKLFSKIQFDKDTIKNNWDEVYHFNYIYSGDSILEIKSKYDNTSNLWKDIYKIKYIISNSKIDKVIGYNLENPNSSYTLGNTISYQYSGNNLTELIAFGVKWSLNYDNNVLSQFVQYSLFQGNWKEFTKCKYNYSSNQLKSLYLYDYNSYGIPNTASNSKYEYEYEGGNISKITIYGIDSSNSIWETKNSTVYHYDNHGCLFEKIQNTGEKTTYLYEVGKGNFSTFKSYIIELDKTPYVN